ncbi:Protein Y54G2A.16, partial [Aphelenchoides avenae]
LYNIVPTPETMPLSKLENGLNGSKRKQLRRTSSLQVPSKRNNQNQSVLFTALSNLKQSTLSMYASTISAAGFLGGGRRSDSAINLYTLMAKYRCCCGFCRLRVGSATIGIWSILYPVAVIASFALFGHFLNPTLHGYIRVPAYAFMAFQILASILLLCGLYLDSHYFMLPFQISCILNMMGSMALGLMLLVSTDRNQTQIYPAFAAVMMGLVAVYLWFLVIISMTFVLIRDKKRLTDSEIDFYNDDDDRAITPDCPPMLERVNSAQF